MCWENICAILLLIVGLPIWLTFLYVLGVVLCQFIGLILYGWTIIIDAIFKTNLSDKFNPE